MKKFGKYLTAAAAGGMLLASSVLTCAAAEDYTYTVTFYAGNQGSFSGTAGLSVDGAADVANEGNRIVVSGLEAGTVLSFDDLQGSVNLEDSGKYYVQGIRESGRDNDEMGPTVIRVSEDTDYVVAYGIRGNMTSYTVSYQDAEGNELAPGRTYYGNVGDKPVVAYLYMEDYVPRTLGLTKTLSANEAENQFVFIYDPVETEVIVEPGETTVITPDQPGTGTGTGAGDAGTGTGAEGTGGAGQTGQTGTDADQPGGAGAEGQEPGGTGGGTGPGGTGEGTEPGGTTEEIGEEEVPQGNQDITDLDDEEIPQGNLNLGGGEEEGPVAIAKSLDTPLIIGAVIGIGAIVVLVSMVIMVNRRRRR